MPSTIQRSRTVRSSWKWSSRSCEDMTPAVKKRSAAHVPGVEVGGGAVGEDVDEDASLGAEPGRDAAQHLLPVVEVLEHLDRDDTVEARRLEVEVVDVGGDDQDPVGDAAALGLGLDPEPLRGRVGDAGDAAARVALSDPEADRAPATAEVEHVLAVFDPAARSSARASPPRLDRGSRSPGSGRGSRCCLRRAPRKRAKNSGGSA